MDFGVVIAPTSTASRPAFPTYPAASEAEITAPMREALQLHLEELRMDGEPVPQPTPRVTYVPIAQRAVIA